MNSRVVGRHEAISEVRRRYRRFSCNSSWEHRPKMTQAQNSPQNCTAGIFPSEHAEVDMSRRAHKRGFHNGNGICRVRINAECVLHLSCSGCYQRIFLLSLSAGLAVSFYRDFGVWPHRLLVSALPASLAITAAIFLSLWNTLVDSIQSIRTLHGWMTGSP